MSYDFRVLIYRGLYINDHYFVIECNRGFGINCSSRSVRSRVAFLKDDILLTGFCTCSLARSWCGSFGVSLKSHVDPIIRVQKSVTLGAFQRGVQKQICVPKNRFAMGSVSRSDLARLPQEKNVFMNRLSQWRSQRAASREC